MLLSAIVLLSALSTPAQAYSRLTTSSGAYLYNAAEHLTLNLNPWIVYWPDRTAAANTAASILYNNPSQYYVSIAWDDDATSEIYNGESELSWTNAWNYLCADDATSGNADGCAIPSADSATGAITEMDVYINSASTFTNSTTKSSLMGYGGLRSLPGILTHEFLHTAGLADSGGCYTMMGQEWSHVSTNGNTTNPHVGEDASAGLKAIYTDASGWEDLGVTHWRWDLDDPPYSIHARTNLWRVSGSSVITLIPTTVSGEPRYSSNKGSKLRMQFTLENSGFSTRTSTVYYMLSTDSTIGTSDTLLSSSSYTLSNDTPLTTTADVTLPSTLTSGATYYLGVIIDPANILAEYNETNNATYVAAIKIN